MKRNEKSTYTLGFGGAVMAAGIEKVLAAIGEMARAGSRFAVELRFDYRNLESEGVRSGMAQRASQAGMEPAEVSRLHRWLNGVAANGGARPGEEPDPRASETAFALIDATLAQRGLRFVRSGDAWVVLCGSARAARRIGASARKLGLAASGSPARAFRVAGYVVDLSEGEAEARVSEQAIRRLKGEIRRLTARSDATPLERRKAMLGARVRAFARQFRWAADIGAVAREVDSYLRERIALVLWKSWKRVRSKVRALRSLGADERTVRRLANRRDGAWACATNPEFLAVLSFEKLKGMGFQFLLPLSVRVGA